MPAEKRGEDRKLDSEVEEEGDHESECDPNGIATGVSGG